MKYYNIEPIIIESNKIGNWNHPNIVEIVNENKDDDQLNEECEVWSGPWIRFIIYNEKTKDFVDVVAALPQEEYEYHFAVYKKFNDTYDENVAHEIREYLISALEVVLREDVWVVNGEQFAFTQYGKKLGNRRQIWSRNTRVTFSPDVGVHVDDEGKWTYST